MQPSHIHWSEAGQACSALWRSERGAAPPQRVVLADDTTTADDAYHLACEGTALLWRGDFQNARQLLQALARGRAMEPHVHLVDTVDEAVELVSLSQPGAAGPGGARPGSGSRAAR